MNKRELVNLLENFKDDVKVCVEDNATGMLCPIGEIVGMIEEETGKFYIRIEIK